MWMIKYQDKDTGDIKDFGPLLTLDETLQEVNKLREAGHTNVEEFSDEELSGEEE